MPSILFLTAYPKEDASCRFRIHLFTKYLESAGYECIISSFATPTLFHALQQSGKSLTKTWHTVYCSLRRARVLHNARDFDLVVIHREAYPFFAPLVERSVLRRHPRVVFSFDDALHAGHDNIAALTHPFLYRIKHGRGYDYVIRRSSYVIAGNRLLAAHASKLNSNVTVVPTVVDTDHFRPKAVSTNSSPLTVGWVGGPSTVSYLETIEPALQKLAHTYADGVQFRFFGCPAYKPKLPGASSLPFRLESEADDVRSLDIGLMPMPDTPWTRGKCAFKAIQYMASGVATVASPVGVTTNLIQHEVNGLLVGSSSEWFTAIERLICDVELRRRIAANARNTIVEHYSLQVWGPRLVDLFDTLLSRNQALPTAVAA